MSTKWNEIHFILNEDGNVIGDFKESDKPYGFLKDGVGFTFDEATPDEKELLVNLVYLFYTLGDTAYRDGFEYVELEGYTMYRKVEHATLYKDLFYMSRSLPEYEFMNLSVLDDGQEYYILTTQDEGMAFAVMNHFDKVYGITVDLEIVEAITPETLDYWNKSTTLLF